MNKLHVRRLLGLLALLVASALLAINEIGYHHSQQAVDTLARSHATRAALDQMLQSMLNAETGQRGYLLTGDERYLRPYQSAVASIQGHLQTIRSAHDSQALQPGDMARLSELIARKLSEMEMSVNLRRQNEDDAWRFVLSTDVGQQEMEDLRTLATQLIQRSADEAGRSTQAIHASLAHSRTGIALAGVLGLVVFYLYLRGSRALRAAQEREQQILERERDRLEQLVLERTASLSRLADHLQQVREDERAHLARELHDELGALLTAAKLDIARLRRRLDAGNHEGAERLQHLSDCLNQVIALKRRIIEDLRPSSLSNLGLVASLEILTREFAQRSGTALQTRLEPVQLSEPAQLTAYRLVQEALTNIHKHAQAHNIWVLLQQHGGQVCVQVRDDGRGFDSAQAPADSHGLLGMRHRVESLGGRLSIETAAGQGTVVRADLPAELPAG